MDKCEICGCRCEMGPAEDGDGCLCDITECLGCQELGCSQPWLER